MDKNWKLVGCTRSCELFHVLHQLKAFRKGKKDRIFLLVRIIRLHAQATSLPTGNGQWSHSFKKIIPNILTEDAIGEGQSSFVILKGWFGL